MTFDPPFPVFVIVALAVAAIGVAIWREISGNRRRLHPRWFHPLCLFLRIGAIAALVLLLLNPSRRTSTEQPASQSVILLDASASMSLAADEENRSRWEVASAYAASALDKMAAAGLGEPKLSTFSAELDVDAVAEKPAGRKTNLAGALERLLAGSRDEAPDQIIVVSDGRIHDRERINAALGLAKAAKVPVSTRVFGIDRPPRNASLAAVQAPSMVRPRSPVAVHVDVTGTGIAPEESLNLKLLDDEGKTLAQSDFYLPGGQASDSKESRPAERALVFESGLRTGRYYLELTVAGEPEADLDDNRFSFTVEIATGKLRVLFVEGTHVKRTVGDTGHWWNDIEHITRSWDATGEIEYECLTPMSEYINRPNLVGVTFHNGEMLPDPSRNFPQTREELFRYDVMLISDVPVGNFSKDQMQWVVDLVEKRGGGFLMGGGYASFDVGNYDKTPWERIIPADMTAYGDGFYQKKFKIEIPESVRDHPLWRISHDPKENEAILETHPVFTGMNRVRRAKPGALVLATRMGSNEPIIAAQRYGRGRSIAFLPDPNGGWARFYLGWGPKGGPAIGAHTELGHGENFKFKEHAANANRGVPPAHPSPWYGRYWVNVVRWLGENSVRWQREKLAGRVIAAQAHPGKKLPVAAEVLPVTELDELLSLDVGARLNLPGSRRVRLLYDRDRREFTGELSVPSSLDESAELGVLFDVATKDQAFSQTVPVGVHRGNPEFNQSAPDPEFLADLARATGGTVLTNVGDAVSSSRAAAEKRLRESHRSWSEPLWSIWWPWIVFAGLFCLEWALRRHGGKVRQESGDPENSIPRAQKAAVLLGAIFLALGTTVTAQEKSIDAWIEQLADGRVRLRDEAEIFLREMPGARAALEEAAATTDHEEAKVRMENILRYFQSHRWRLIATRVGHAETNDIMSHGLAATPDGTKFFTRGRDHVRAWDSETMEPGETFGDSNFQVEEGWLRAGLVKALAVSPDGARIVSTNEYSEIIIHDVASLTEIARFSVPEAAPFIEKQEPNKGGTVFSAAFLSDNKTLITGVRWGARLWNTETREEIWANGDLGFVGYEVAVSPDETKVLVAGQSQGKNPLFTLDIKTGAVLAVFDTPKRFGGLLFDSTGKRVLAKGQDGFARILDYDPETGTLKVANTFGPHGNDCSSVVWGPGEKTILASSFIWKQPLTEWDIETGKAIWRAPNIGSPIFNVTHITKNRLVATGRRGMITIWQFSGQ